MGRRGAGEGHIYRRDDGRWEAKLDLGWAGGRRRRKSIYGRTRAEVADKLRKAQSHADAGLPVLDERRTVADYLTWWAEAVLPGTVKDTTADGYRDTLARYAIPHVGKVRLARLGPAHVHSMLRALEAAGLSPRTRQLTRSILRRALRDAERFGLVARNAAASVESPKVGGAQLDDALSVDEAKALLAAAAGDRLEAIVTVALTIGLRKGEALALRWDDVDLDAGELTVRATLKRRTGHGLILDEPKTSRGRRTIALPSTALSALRAHRVRQMEERLRAGSLWRESGYVFTTPVGTPIDPRNLTAHYHALTDRAGLGRRRFHALRHTAATLMLAQGVPLEVISATLGHAGYAITADVYAHVRKTLQRQAADAMDAALGGGSRP